MVKRYFELLEFIDVEDDDIMELLPPRRQTSDSLQGRDVDLLDVPLWFDELISVKPHYARFIGPRTNIVHSPYFESECVRVLGGNADRLTRAEKVALQPFAVTAPADARESLEEQQDSFVERLRKCRRLYEERSS
ncbi:hypothetical protein PC117_g23626 [Phytophthora cactorum]|uniref:Uncharacterized protein n=1 Tax=Phytophthora cactorum TaxID=29920 RepID=A0A8T1B2D5_9STRA|nr:hypothetical protein PC117_g23626 [Phytophthora cactorum]